MPIGFKNGTDGSGAHSDQTPWKAAARPHHFLASVSWAICASFSTTGNPDGPPGVCAAAKGGKQLSLVRPLAAACLSLAKAGLPPRLWWICSHGTQQDYGSRLGATPGGPAGAPRAPACVMG